MLYLQNNIYLDNKYNIYILCVFSYGTTWSKCILGASA